MAKLTAAARNKIPAKKFGLPGSRKYPMPNVAHAINAKARATQQLDAGNLSADEHAAIVSKADRMIYGRDH
jgi:hypothetical protein